MVPDSRFEADMKIELVFGVILGPGYLLKAVGLCVDELGILWNRLVWIPWKEEKEEMKIKERCNQKS